MKKENIEDKIVLTLNASEISQIITCLDFYSRIWIGQYLEIDNEMLWIKEDISRSDSEIAVTPFFREIRKKVLPKLEESLHSSYGIFSHDIDVHAGIAYDLQQVIRYTQAWFVNPEGGWTVDYGRPLQANKEIPLANAECNRVDDKLFMKLTLTDPIQLSVLQDAVKIYQCLLQDKIRELFTYYTKDEESLRFAERIEKYYKKFKVENRCKESIEKFLKLKV